MVAIKIAMPANFLSIFDMSGRLGGRLLVAVGEVDLVFRSDCWVEVAMDHHFVNSCYKCHRAKRIARYR